MILTPRVRYYGQILNETGFGEAARGYCEALRKAGCELDLRPLYAGDTERLEERYSMLIPLIESHPDDPNWPTHTIVHELPTNVSGIQSLTEENTTREFKGRWVCMTTWETTRLAKEVAQDLTKNFDALYTPSRFVEKAFTDSGVPKEKVRVVPHSFDPDWWWSEATEPKKDNPIYHFYSIFAWRDSKYPLGLLIAYLSEFYKKDNVCLTLLVDAPERARAATREVERMLRLDSYAPVVIIGPEWKGNCSRCLLGFPNPQCRECHGKGQVRTFAWYPDQVVRQLHHDSDCYVTTTRGEGWGLPAFEACLMNKPVIAPRFSGLIDFLDHYPGTVYIQHSKLPCLTSDDGVLHGIRGDQEWIEPNLEDLRKYMRFAYRDRWYWNQPNQQLSLADRELFRGLFSQESVGKKFRKMLELM